MTVKAERPTGIKGLVLGVDPTLADGALTVADGIRYLELGSVQSRSGVRTARYPDGSPVRIQAINPGGIFPMLDDDTYLGDGIIGTQVLKYVSKAGNAIYVDGTVIGYRGTTSRAQMLGYGPGVVYILDGDAKMGVLRRKKTQVVGQKIAYELVDAGLDWPTTNTRPVLSIQAGGAINPTLEPYRTGQTYRVRITVEDEQGIVSNPSIQSLDLANPAADKDKKIRIDWTGMEAGFPARAVKVQPWIQMSMEGVVSSYLMTPEGAGSGKFLRSDAGYTGIFDLSTVTGSETWPTLEETHGFDRGAAPRAFRGAFVKNRLIAIASPDYVKREKLAFGWTGRPPSPAPASGDMSRQPQGAGLPNDRPAVNRLPWQGKSFYRAAGATIEKVRVGRSEVFVSRALEPQYMEAFFTVGDGTESAQAVVGMGDYASVFTDKSIWIYNVETASCSPTYATIGTTAPDSIVKTRDGVFFLGTDGGFYRWNGATVESLGGSLSPIFKREDYEGYYRRYDSSRAVEVSSCYGQGRVFWVIPDKTADGTPGYSLVTVELSPAGPVYSIDLATEHRLLATVPSQNRVLAASHVGFCYWIEEGLVDETVSIKDESTTTTGIRIALRWKKIVGNDYGIALWRKFSFDIDPGGADLTATVMVDDNPAMSKTYPIAGSGRIRFGPEYLPAHFRGRFATCDIRGTTNGRRVNVYGLDIEPVETGEF